MKTKKMNLKYFTLLEANGNNNNKNKKKNENVLMRLTNKP